MITRFLDVVLDGDARTVTRGSMPVRLSPKALDVLLLLVSERPRAVPKDEILVRAWPGTFVTDASLARAVHEIREALGDDHSTSAIRTVHGHGYAFAAEATDEARQVRATASDARPVGWLIAGGRAIPVVGAEVLIGRDPTSDVPLASALVSWHHARLIVDGGIVTLDDLGSKNGTLVRGERVDARTILEDDDDIEIAGTILVFRRGQKQSDTATAVD